MKRSPWMVPSFVAALCVALGCATVEKPPTSSEIAAMVVKGGKKKKVVVRKVKRPVVSPPPEEEEDGFETADVAPLLSPAPMELVSLPVANKPLVSFRLVFRTGSVDDPRGKEGLTYLTAEVMAQGGTQKLSSSALLETLFPMAAELESSVDKELTTFVGRVHKDNVDKFFEIFTDVLLEPRWDPKEFDRLRADAVNNVRNHLRGEDDEQLGKVALDAILYEGHPYGHYEGGTVHGLQSIALDDVKAHWKKVFTQDRLVIGLAGAVDGALEKRVKDRLALLPATGAPRAVLSPVERRFGQVIIVKKDALSTAISMGYTYPLRRGDPDYFPVAFALSYLGQHRQSQGVLFNELREKRGMNYGDYAYAEHFSQDGYSTMPSPNVARAAQDFSIWLRPTEPQNAVFATRGALHFLQRLIEKPIPQGEFDRARGFLAGLTRVWEQTDQRKLGFAIDDKFYGTKNFHESFRHALQQMTPQQVHEAVKRHLDPSSLNFAFVAKDAEGVQKALALQAATPIMYPTPKPAEVMAEDQSFGKLELPILPDDIRIVKAQDFMERAPGATAPVGMR